MILGIGVDVQEVSRLEAAVARLGRDLLDRAFLPEEQEECFRRARPYEGLAARWAAKEAVFKALKTGWGGETDWLNIHCQRRDDGAPSLRFMGPLSWLNEITVHVSLTHSQGIAMAMIVLERMPMLDYTEMAPVRNPGRAPGVRNRVFSFPDERVLVR